MERMVSLKVREKAIEENIFEARSSFELRTKLLLPLLEDREMQRFITVWLGLLKALDTSIVMALSRLFDDRKDVGAGNLRALLKHVKSSHPRSKGSQRTVEQVDFLNRIDNYISEIKKEWSKLKTPRHTFFAHTALGNVRAEQHSIDAIRMINLAEEVHDSYCCAFKEGSRPHQDSSLQWDMNQLAGSIGTGSGIFGQPLISW